jgi:hypothetical protein
MGKTRKAMIAFIDDIPDSKLEGGISSGTIYTDHRNFRLDNQGVSVLSSRLQVPSHVLKRFSDYHSKER